MPLSHGSPQLLSGAPDPAGLSEEELHAALLARIQWLRGYIETGIPARFRAEIAADEILQEIWMSAYRNYQAFRPDGPGALDRWLIRIASTRLTDALRAIRRGKRGGEMRRVPEAAPFSRCSGLFARLRSPGRTPSRELHAHEAAHAVLIALGRLGEPRRTAVELRYIRGLSRGEIAGRMGKSEAAINSLLFNGLRDLKGYLGNAGRYFSDCRSTESPTVESSGS